MNKIKKAVSILTLVVMLCMTVRADDPCPDGQSPIPGDSCTESSETITVDPLTALVIDLINSWPGF